MPNTIVVNHSSFICNWFLLVALEPNYNWDLKSYGTEAKVPDNTCDVTFMQFGKGQLITECAYFARKMPLLVRY